MGGSVGGFVGVSVGASVAGGSVGRNVDVVGRKVVCDCVVDNAIVVSDSWDVGSLVDPVVPVVEKIDGSEVVNGWGVVDDEEESSLPPAGSPTPD